MSVLTYVQVVVKTKGQFCNYLENWVNCDVNIGDNKTGFRPVHDSSKVKASCYMLRKHEKMSLELKKYAKICLKLTKCPICISIRK